MAEHTINLGVDERKRYTNDPEYHWDVESQLVKLLERWWKPENTQNITPKFYLTEKDITHDLATCPAIVVYENYDRSNPVGIGYEAEKLEMPMNIEIISLDRGLLFDTHDEALRVLKFCRKRPLPGWDVMFSTSNKHVEPRAGNYHISISSTMMRFVRPILETRPPLRAFAPGLPSLEIAGSIIYDAGNSVFNEGLSATATGGDSPYSYSWLLGTSTVAITTRLVETTSTVVETANKVRIADNNGYSTAAQVVFSSPTATPTAHTMDGNFNVIVSAHIEAFDEPLVVDYSATVTGGKYPYTYEWYFDDFGSPTTTSSVTVTYSSLSNIKAKLVVTDANGVSISATIFASI